MLRWKEDKMPDAMGFEHKEHHAKYGPFTFEIKRIEQQWSRLRIYIEVPYSKNHKTKKQQIYVNDLSKLATAKSHAQNVLKFIQEQMEYSGKQCLPSDCAGGEIE